MFSYQIQNPANILQENYYVVPFGHRCSSALVCKYASLRKFSLPFDWTIPLFPKCIQHVLENEFSEFVPDVRSGIFENKYGIRLAHFNIDVEEGCREYTRRIQRMNELLNDDSKHIYFVYINEDHLYDPFYRTDEFDRRNFMEMVELEQWIRKKYPHLHFHILYFNFREQCIPDGSNIINIVLNTGVVYDYFVPSYAEDFRNYCGKIMTHLFNTQLELGYTDEIFLA